jgi:hypothetical protein
MNKTTKDAFWTAEMKASKFIITRSIESLHKQVIILTSMLIARNHYLWPRRGT